MPSLLPLRLAWSSSGGDRTLELLWCGFCPWWMGRWWGGSEGASTLNKLDFPSKKSDVECSVLVLAAMEVGSADDGGYFFDLQVLEESGGDFYAGSPGKFISADVCCCFADGAASGRASSTASSPPILQAEGRPLPPSRLAKDGQHKGSINLLFWRPCYPAVVGSRCGDPSGFVPGVAVVGHGVVRARRGDDGAGLDCVFHCNSEVHGANHKDLVVILIFGWVLFMYCNASAGN